MSSSTSIQGMKITIKVLTNFKQKENLDNHRQPRPN